MDKQSKILVTGASGLIGSALVRLLKAEGYKNILTPTHKELRLCTQRLVHRYFKLHQPEYVFHLAAQVGGIKENSKCPAQFIYVNTAMHTHVIHACYKSGVKKLLSPGSACAYPAITDRPIKESDFLRGPPESTNLAYAIAKQNGIVMAQSYAKQYGMKVVLPMVANAYGPNDRSTHVIPMLIKKIKDEQKNPDRLTFWGTGKPLREFIHAEDVASAFLFLMLNYESSEIINVGTGDEISIKELAHTVAALFSYEGLLGFNLLKPDGIARKCLDSSCIRALGWAPKIKLEDGLRGLIND